MILDLDHTYHREDNLLYQDGIPIVWFIADTFIDLPEMKENHIKYMERYINMWPNRIEEL